MIEPLHLKLTIRTQCELLGINRSSYYYGAKEPEQVEQALLDEILAIHIRHPYMGSRSIKDQLNRKNYKIGRKKVIGLMKALKIKAFYPKPNLSISNKEHKKYPYLLKELEITMPNQVWSTDITYIRTRTGFMYLTAVIDVYSRYIVSWELSNSLSKDMCTNVIKAALQIAKPEIVNTDQGSQYTSIEFVELIDKNGIKLSMDSKGRALDNIWIERFWRTIKYQEIYLKEYKTVMELYNGIKEFIDFYNSERGHQSLKNYTPEFIYKGIVKIAKKKSA
jgi:putative transposase